MLNERCSLKARQLSHWLQASPSDVGALAVYCLGKYARAGGLAYAARAAEEVGVGQFAAFSPRFFSVVVSAVWPTTESNEVGLYFRAETMYSSIVDVCGNCKTMQTYSFFPTFGPFRAGFLPLSCHTHGAAGARAVAGVLFLLRGKGCNVIIFM